MPRPNEANPDNDREARTQRAIVVAIQLDAERVLPWGDTDLCTDRPMVFVKCRIHGEVQCLRVACDRCGTIHNVEKFILPVQSPPVGPSIIEPVDFCSCGLEHMHAICEHCDEATELQRSGLPVIGDAKEPNT